MTMSKKTDVRGKLESECNAVEQEMIRHWFEMSHSSNYPVKRDEARWTFCPKYGAKLFAGFL